MRELFKNKNFMFYWFGQTISGTGNWINFIALNLFVLETFGSAGTMGIFLVIRMLPSVLSGSFGGFLADRLNKKKLMITCDILRALIVPCFIFTRNLYVFFLLGLLLSALDKVFMSTRGAFIPGIVRKDKIVEANSFCEMTRSVITIVGPALGAMLLLAFNYKTILIIDSMTFVVSVICLMFISYLPEKTSGWDKKKNNFMEFINEQKETLIFLKNHSLLLFAFVVRLFDALGSGAYNAALPVFSRYFSSIEIFSKRFVIENSASYGWIVGIWALGQFIGSFSANSLLKKSKISPENILIFSILIKTIGMGLTFQNSILLYALIFIFIGGLGDGVANVFFLSLIMKESPDNKRGKIFGLIFSILYSTLALGILLAGLYIDSYSVKIITGIASLIILLGIAVGKGFLCMKTNIKCKYPSE